MSSPAAPSLPWPVVALALGTLAFVAFLYLKSPEIAQKRDEVRLRGEEAERAAERVAGCAALRAELEARRHQSADLNDAQRLEDEWRACLETIGTPAEQYQAGLVAAQGKRQQIGREFTHYQGTAYHDGDKRNNTHKAWLRLASDAMRDFRDAIDKAITQAALDEIQRELDGWQGDAMLRVTCFRTGGYGCGRWGALEDDEQVRALQEYENAVAPIVGAAAGLAYIDQFGWLPRRAVAEVGPGLLAHLAARRAQLRPNYAATLAATGRLLTPLNFMLTPTD